MEGLRAQIGSLILMPVCAVLLPWPIFFRFARYVARYSWFYEDETQQAAAAAKASGLVQVDADWMLCFRLNKLIDSADPWLSLLRGKAWMQRYIDVEGKWPQQTPFVACSMHYGTGLWVLRHIRQNCGPIAMLLRPQAEWKSAFSCAMQLYLEVHEYAIAIASGAPIERTGAGLTKRIADLFAGGNSLLVLIDVPQGTNRNPIAVDFMGQPTYFANGMIGMTLQQQCVPVPFTMSLDVVTGRRKLHIGKPVENAASLEQAMQQLTDFFEPFVQGQSAAWHLWAQYPAFLHPQFER